MASDFEIKKEVEACQEYGLPFQGNFTCTTAEAHDAIGAAIDTAYVKVGGKGQYSLTEEYKNFYNNNGKEADIKTEIFSDNFDETANFKSMEYESVNIKTEVKFEPETRDDCSNNPEESSESSFSSSHSVRKKVFQNIQRPVTAYSAEEPFQCDISQEYYTSNTILPCFESHTKTHRDEALLNQFKCKICSKQFNRKKGYMRHILIHSGVKPFQCDVCEMRFLQKGHLKTHSLKHSGEKQFQCGVCQKQFMYKRVLQMHLRTHSEERPFQCVACQMRFRMNGNLQRHMLVHSGEKPFACEVCQSRFNKRQYLQRHQLTHTGEKPFQCDVCQRRFTQKGHLKNHLLTHSEKKPFKCDICQKQFLLQQYLTKHNATHG